MTEPKSRVLFLSVLMALASVLFITAGSTNSTEIEGSYSENEAGGRNYDYDEVFSAGGTNGWVYVNWEASGSTNEFSCAWFLGAYRFNDGSLSIDLDRKFLSNDVFYAIHYSCGGSASAVADRATASDRAALFLNLCDTNGAVLVESEDLLTSSNVIHYAMADTDDAVILLSVPIEQYPDAAILQTVGRHNMAASDDSPVVSGIEPGTILIREGLLFIDGNSDLWSSDGQGHGTTNYPDGNSLSNFYDWINGTNTGASTNNPGGDGNGGDTDEDDDSSGSRKQKIVYVDQAKGNDSLTGRAPDVSGNKKGPKKTVRGGLSAAEPTDTIIIKSGTYNENLNISGKDVKVFIEGNVRL